MKHKTLVKFVFFFMLLLSLTLLANLTLAETLHVKRVVDSDTVLLSNAEKVRLIGVDTPESYESKKLYRDAQRTGRDIKTIQALGKKATKFTTKLAYKKKVRLEFDHANAYLDHRDRYGQLLAYVFLEDETLLNAEIIRQGYGHAYTHYPFQDMEKFRKYEKEAREAGRGLWGDEIVVEKRAESSKSAQGNYVASRRSKVFHFPF